MPPQDCTTYCDNDKKCHGLYPPSTPNILATFASTAFSTITFNYFDYPSEAEVRNYLKAIADAGRIRIEAFQRDERLSYTFLCRFRAGTTFFHGTLQDFTNGGLVQIYRGAFYTTWIEYANFLLWVTLRGQTTNPTDPRLAVVLEYQPPAGEFLYVNSRDFTGNMLTSAQGHHGVAANGGHPDTEFPGSRNYAAHAKIFCNSVANYGVPNLEGVIQVVTVDSTSLHTTFAPIVATTGLGPFCTRVGGTRGTNLQQGFASVAGPVNINDRRILTEFEEVYWNARPNPTGQRPLPNLPPLPNAINRDQQYEDRLVALLQTDYPGTQYTFDYRTYGALAPVRNEHGLLTMASPRACLTALCRSRADLNTMCDNMLEYLRKRFANTSSQGAYANLRQLVAASSNGPLTPTQISTVRLCASALLQAL